MEQARALILKVIDSVDCKVLLLHEKHGKILAYSKKRMSSVCPGMFIVCAVTQKRNTFYIAGYEQIALPVLHSQEQLYQLHSLLHSLDVLVPMQGTLEGVHDALLYVYEPGRVLSQVQYQFFFLTLCLAAGVFPEDPQMYHLVLTPGAQIHKLLFSQEQEQKIYTAFVWCTQYVSSRKK